MGCCGMIGSELAQKIRRLNFESLGRESSIYVKYCGEYANIKYGVYTFETANVR